MPILTPKDLSELVALLDAADSEARDELLTDLLVLAYPTLAAQDD